MPFFCYIHREGNGVPHFEVLPDLSERAAQARAVQLLAQRVDAVRAEIWDGDTLILTVPQAQPTAAADLAGG